MAKAAIEEVLEEYHYAAKDGDAVIRKAKVRRADGTVEKIWQRFDDDRGDWVAGYRWKYVAGGQKVETGIEPDWFMGDRLRAAVEAGSDGFLNTEAINIYLVDGEKDAKRSWDEGRAAVCSPHGMGHFPRELAGFLVESGCGLILVPDQDGGKGDKQAVKVAKLIRDTGGKVGLLYPAGGAKDLYDHFEAGGSWDTLSETKARTSGDQTLLERFLGQAISRVRDKGEGRNDTGAWLAQQLRDMRLSRDEAYEVLERYWEAVHNEGSGGDYAITDVEDTLNSTWSREPRNYPGDFEDKRGRGRSGGEKGAEGAPGEFPWSDLGNGRRLVQRHGERLRYVHAWKRWLFWDGARWYVSDGDVVMRLMNAVLEEMEAEAAAITDLDLQGKFEKFLTRSEGIGARKSALESASNEEEVVVGVDGLDADPWLLNVRNGTLDLRTGELLPHDPLRLITKLAPVEWDPKAKCPTFGAFIVRAFPDAELLGWVQRIVGYILTGKVSEKAYFTLLGETNTGKTVFINTIQKLLGLDYAQQMKSSELMSRKLESDNNVGMADLKGKRFASISEPAQGARLDVAAIKHITGGGRVRASRKYENPFEFQPEAKIVIDTNHELTISDTDDSIWYRTNVVPFKEQIPMDEQDPDLEAKLELELPGILRWAVAGCLEWQRIGLARPEAARLAEAEYREDQDPLRDFIEERCVLGEGQEEYGKILWTAYTDWCEENKVRFVLSNQAWSVALKSRGCVKLRKVVNGRKTAIWYGIGLAVGGS